MALCLLETETLYRFLKWRKAICKRAPQQHGMSGEVMDSVPIGLTQQRIERATHFVQPGQVNLH
ncbi:hypothetical protein D3C87_1965850 [compost metagenome]